MAGYSYRFNLLRINILVVGWHKGVENLTGSSSFQLVDKSFIENCCTLFRCHQRPQITQHLRRQKNRNIIYYRGIIYIAQSKISNQVCIYDSNRVFIHESIFWEEEMILHIELCPGKHNSRPSLLHKRPVNLSNVKARHVSRVEENHVLEHHFFIISSFRRIFLKY